MSIKNIVVILWVSIPVYVSVILPQICEYLENKFSISHIFSGLIFSSIISFILYIIEKYRSDQENYGRFEKFVNDMSKDYNNIDSNFKRLEQNFNLFHKYHEDIKIYMDANTDKNQKLADLVNQYNKERFRTIGSIVEELQDEFCSKVNFITDKFESKIYKSNKKEFLFELNSLYSYTVKKLHSIETNLNNYSKDDIHNIDKSISNV